MVPVTAYLIRAYHAWIEDVGLTAHILVDCSQPGVIAPKPYIQQEKIAFNISKKAVNSLLINNDAVSFKARFHGETASISVPISAIFSIYAVENGEGMFFENTAAATPAKKRTGAKLTLLD